MELDDRYVPRPRSTEKPGIGDQRYGLLKAAFAHAQAATLDGYPLEAIAILESLLTDRLGSMVHGSLGITVRLGDSLGKLAKLAEKNAVDPSVLDGSAARNTGSRKSPFPDEVVSFMRTDVQPWWKRRSNAVHAMAKLRLEDERTFETRHAELLDVALQGVRILLLLDAFDLHERQRNGAKRAATVPDALVVTSLFQERFAMFAAPANKPR
jgi:hypothetical protein